MSKTFMMAFVPLCKSLCKRDPIIIVVVVHSADVGCFVNTVKTSIAGSVLIAVTLKTGPLK